MQVWRTRGVRNVCLKEIIAVVNVIKWFEDDLEREKDSLKDFLKMCIFIPICKLIKASLKSVFPPVGICT